MKGTRSGWSFAIKFFGQEQFLAGKLRVEQARVVEKEEGEEEETGR